MKVIRNEAHTNVKFPALAKCPKGFVWVVQKHKVSDDKYVCYCLETGESSSFDGTGLNANYDLMSVGSEVKLVQTAK